MKKYLFKCHNSSSFFVPAESTGGRKYYPIFLNGNQTLAHVLGAVYFAVSSLANSIQSFVFGDGITISDTCSEFSPIYSQALEQSVQIIPPQAPFLYDECEAGLNRCLNDARRESVAHGTGICRVGLGSYWVVRTVSMVEYTTNLLRHVFYLRALFPRISPRKLFDFHAESLKKAVY